MNTTTAVDLQSGKVLWKQPIGASGLLAGQGVIYTTRVLPGSDAEPVTNGYILALNPTTGAVLWQANGHAYVAVTNIGNHLYAADSATGLYSFNAQTGAQGWSQSLPNINWLTPQATTLYFSDGKKVYALDMTSHAIQWQTPFTGAILRYQSATLCASDFSQVLYGYDAQSGAELWHVSVSSGYAALLANHGLCFAAASIHRRTACHSLR
jgi:outer membrane protein assembly factor BamB